MDNSKAEIANRFKELRKVHLLMNQSDLADIFGVASNTISDMENGKTSVSIAAMLTLAKEYNINTHWLMTGEGAVFSHDISDFIVKPGEPENNSHLYKSPDLKFYDSEDSLNIEIFDDENGKLASSIFNINIFRDCDIALTFTGNAMAPRYNIGDIIICMQVTSWNVWVEYGQLFLIVTTDNQRIIRYLRKSSKEGFFKLTGHNPDFDEIDLPISEINFLYLVKGKIERIR